MEEADIEIGESPVPHKKQRGFRGRYLSISLDRTSQATSFSRETDIFVKEPGSENRYASVLANRKDRQLPNLVPYANLEPDGGALLVVREDGETVLQRQLALAYLDGVKLLPPESMYSDRDESLFEKYGVNKEDTMGCRGYYMQRHGRAKWTRWVLELPEGEHFEPEKLEIPVFTGYTIEEPHPDFDVEFFCDPKRIRYGGRLPDAESMEFRCDAEHDEEIQTIVEL